MKDSFLFSFHDSFLSLEKELWEENIHYVAGVDEVGRGALAGPVVAAAVIMKSSCEELVGKVKDSKQLNPQEREELFPQIEKHTLSIGIGIVTHIEIDQMNILQASLKAMRLAVEKLFPTPLLCLIDGNQKAPLSIPQRTIVKGDQRVFSIAAASIIAKVTRDQMMKEVDAQYPMYGFAKHKGYGTQDHRIALQTHGPCDLHRRSFTLGVS